MPKNSFDLTVVTPERTAIDRRVVSVTIPTYDGYIGIWANHAPLMAGMRIGSLEYETENGVKEVLAVTNGFVEVADNRVLILADAVEHQDEINIERARQARKRAEERLAEGRSEIDLDRASEAIKRAENRLKIVEKKTRQS